MKAETPSPAATLVSATIPRTAHRPADLNAKLWLQANGSKRSQILPVRYSVTDLFFKRDGVGTVGVGKQKQEKKKRI